MSPWPGFYGPLLWLLFRYYTVSLLSTVLFLLIGFLLMVILGLSLGASRFMVNLWCDSWLLRFICPYSMGFNLMSKTCSQRLTVPMFNSQKYRFAIGRSMCFLQLAVLLKINPVCFMPKSPWVPFRTTFMLTAAKPTTLKIKQCVCQTFSSILSNLYRCCHWNFSPKSRSNSELRLMLFCKDLHFLSRKGYILAASVIGMSSWSEWGQVCVSSSRCERE